MLGQKEKQPSKKMADIIDDGLIRGAVSAESCRDQGSTLAGIDYIGYVHATA